MLIEVICSMNKSVPKHESSAAFASYQQIGRLLAEENSAPLISFNKFLDAEFLMSSARDIPPFTFILASSGTGKTQLPFALRGRKVLYLPLFSLLGTLLKNNRSIHFSRNCI